MSSELLRGVRFNFLEEFVGTFSRSSLALFGKELSRGCRRTFCEEFVSNFSRSSLELFREVWFNFFEKVPPNLRNTQRAPKKKKPANLEKVPTNSSTKIQRQPRIHRESSCGPQGIVSTSSSKKSKGQSRNFRQKSSNEKSSYELRKKLQELPGKLFLTPNAYYRSDNYRSKSSRSGGV
jgi:hypothetical protein